MTGFGISERYRKISDLPDLLPVFPLKSVIVLPRATLPLNVFEPRYLTMVDDVLGNDRIVGIIQPEMADEADQSPIGSEISLRSVGCAGRITAFQETDDGRMLITLSGVCRFELRQEVESDDPYRLFQADYSKFSSDLEKGTGEDEVNRDHLLTVLRTYLKINELNADWQSIDKSSNEFLVNTLSMISPYGPAEKQALLEAPTLSDRSEVLVALAEMELASRDDGSDTTIQ